MMPESLTDSIQDYLKLIYELSERGGTASTTALAKRLGIAPASVTGMIQRLSSARPALVSYRKYRSVTLTHAGRRAALEVIRHHRLLEAWLVQTLGYSWDEVHDEAEKLEHAISEDFERRMAASLGDPDRDPHGDPIPNADLVMPADKSVSLSSLQPDQAATVCRVQERNPEILRYLEKLGLVPGARLKVLAVSPFDQTMHLKVRGRKKESILGPPVTSQVFVEIL
ncbi:MAG: metal-dependent transcriptional regulator [Anaerolineales bacterium]|jgi:DtxR family Mn-dependent transcriptional regulator